MKLSSVEWLFQQLWEKPKDKMEWYALFKEAKEMHKQEIIDAREDGIKAGYGDYIDTEWGRDGAIKSSEQYYKLFF